MKRTDGPWRRALAAAVLAGSVAQGTVRLPRARDYVRQDWRGRRDLGDDALLGVLGVAMIAAPAAYASGRLARFDYPLGPAGRRALAAAGGGLLAASLWLFGRSHADLGRNWTPHVQVRSGQDLVTSGVYAHVRHPMYASQFLLYAAQACLLQNWVAGWAGLVSFAPFYARRVAREEAMMAERFGGAWRQYAERTGRVLPRWTLRASARPTTAPPATRARRTPARCRRRTR